MPLFPPEKPLAQRPYLAGALFWIGFSFVAVSLRGVRWDENYEFAQVILGQIPYPEEHPLTQYVRGFYSLQTYSLAGLMYFMPGPLVANFLRNWLFLLSSTVPVFLLGALFSRRQLVGHLAVVFILLQIHVSFYSTYPIHVWPGAFSNGPVGMGYMLGTLWALLDRRLRLAGLLIGLAPAVHLGQFPPLLATAGACGIYLFATGQRNDLTTLARYCLPGLVVCACFAGFLRGFAIDPPVSGPYYTELDPMVLWHTYMDRYATHRALPYGTGHVALIASVLVGVALPLFYWKGILPPERPAPEEPPLDFPRAWAALYCVVASVTVWGIMAVHAWMGADVPFLLAAWLPYRLMNHVSPVLIPLLLAICYDRDNRIPYYLPLLLLAALVAPLAHLGLPHAFVERYLTPNAFLYFLLAGAAGGTAIVFAARAGRKSAVFVAGVMLVALGALAWFHQFGAACALLGIALGAIPAPWIPNRFLQVSSAVLACLVLLALTARQREDRDHLSRTAFHRAVAEYLEARDEPEAMILTPYMQVGEQMKFGHPVMADMATLYHGIYRPAIAPSVNTIFEDFYGISMNPARDPARSPRAWHEIWPEKSLDEWQALAGKYGVRYVAAPGFMPLPLEAVAGASGRILYRIP